LNNLKFARAVEPANLELINYTEQAARTFDAAVPEDEVAAFAAIRQWKNEFR